MPDEMKALKARINRLIGAIEGKDAILRQYRIGRGSPPETAFRKIDALRPGDLERFPRGEADPAPAPAREGLEGVPDQDVQQQPQETAEHENE